MVSTRKNIVFLTGTRADFGKLKSIIRILNEDSGYQVSLFVTGMHMLRQYGFTVDEVEKSKICRNRNIYKYINQNLSDSMDIVLSKTIQGFSDYIKECSPDLIVVHGDRVEALAGAIVGSLNNIRVAHIEGGEVSGTIDELIRHAVSKMAHIHFVANNDAKQRLIQLGERSDNVFVIGSPDFDIMASDELPSIDEVKSRYTIKFDDYAIALFHPVTTELKQVREHTANLIAALKATDEKYVVIYPNNDSGADTIIEQIDALRGDPQFRVFASMRFEYFLSLLKSARFIVGNSSAGVREAPFYGVPSINIGTRQANRAIGDSIINCSQEPSDIKAAIERHGQLKRKRSTQFGKGNSNRLFKQVLDDTAIWATDIQKQFVDIN